MTPQPYQKERNRMRRIAMALVVMTMFACSLTVRAQWTQPDASGNINSTNTGNVGVGTTAPGTKLTISNNTQAAPAGLTGTTLQVVGANGVTPRLLIDAFGPVASSIDLRKSNNTALSPTALLNNEVIGQISWQGRGATSYNGSSRAKIIVSAAENYTDTAQGAFMMFHVAPRGGLTAVEAMRIDATGFVGLGTPAPGFRLDVQSGQINASGGLCIAGICKNDWSQVGNSQWTTASSTIYYNGNIGVGTAGAPTRRLDVLGGNIFHQFSTTAGSEYGFYTAINNNHFTSNLYFDGQWKMITTGKGSFVSTAPPSGFAFSVFADNTSRAANALASFTQLLTVTMAGNVGVGTSTPAYSLDVNGGVNGFRAKAATVAAGDAVAVFENNSSIQMIVRGDGNVGLGTPNPSEKLDVIGNLKVSGTGSSGNITATGTIEGGNVKARYQDVAEWVDSSEELSAGTVVVLDSSKSNQVIASTMAYDSRVAGVISLQPGIALGEEGKGRVLVATTGRVKVRVDASNGPINIGDLLVTSDKSGLAMKSVAVEIGGVRIHRPGTLVGKALEPLSGGTGEILVLLSLQ